ncbi:hypothetical protein GCM10011357_02420 [Lacimicrobium alkaliphilum]|uniref:Uncharacterized protein n=2 Tax=Lacimicrobium alkaliphilum TaxID=1526571 RepID=A0ABQ1QZN9_9ALTE|nr:hypothetical protein GCM10011357_02420 [Lacimicrobium alkaliphilum]
MAQRAVTFEVLDTPGQQLQKIFQAHHLFIEARQVYRKADVFGLAPESFSDFEDKLATFNPRLAEYALDLMRELMDRTLVLRKKVQKIRNAESGVGNVSGDESIRRLSRLYNEEVYKCCLKDIYTVIEILHE